MMKSVSVGSWTDVIVSGQWSVLSKHYHNHIILLYLTQTEVIVCIFFDLLFIRYNDDFNNFYEIYDHFGGVLVRK